jgi:hypothetical protein
VDRLLGEKGIPKDSEAGRQQFASLVERRRAEESSADTNSPYIPNSLFYGGTFNFAPNVTNALVKDNLFDQTSIPTNTSIYVTYNGGYNAYVTNNARLLPLFATEKGVNP